MAGDEDLADVVQPWVPRPIRIALTCVAVAYLALLSVSTRGNDALSSLPATAQYFLKAACLFPHAAVMSIEYRVEGYSCDRERYVDLDHRPYFPMRADDKESRFHRVGFFFRNNRDVMSALDDYLVSRHGQRPGGDGIDGPIGGIRLFSLRIPLPQPGDAVARYRWRPLSDYPADQRVRWYVTPARQRVARCKAAR